MQVQDSFFYRDDGPRLVSVEQEVATMRGPCGAFEDGECSCAYVNECHGDDDGAASVALDCLREAHVIDADSYVGGYGGWSGTLAQHVRVERDSSCGGEVIHSCVRLGESKGAAILARSVNALTPMDTDETCGLHIHVDMRGATVETCVSLYHVWNYLERVLFALAQESPDGHRTAIGNSEYSPPTEKGMIGGRVTQIGGRHSLNLTNYLYALRNECACGSVFVGRADECTCTGGKRTVEFRVWDGTTDPRRIRLAIDLSLALVQHVWGRRVDPDRLPIYAYAYAPADHSDRRAIVRLRFIMDRLPILERTRFDIGYQIATRAQSLLPIMEAHYPQYLPGSVESDTHDELYRVVVS